MATLVIDKTPAAKDTKIPPHALPTIVEAYADAKPKKKAIDAIYKKCVAYFKEDGRDVFKTKKFTVTKDVSISKRFSKEAFVAVHGEAAYNSFCVDTPSTEFIVTKNK